MSDTNEEMQPIGEDAPPPAKRQSSLLRRRQNDSYTAQKPEKKPSALGGDPAGEPKRSVSFLEKLKADQVPPRSPVGAMRTQSGVKFAPLPPAEESADTEEVTVGEPWHLMPLEEAFEKLKTRATGLSSTEHKALLEEHGLNQITPQPKLHPFLKFLISLVQGFQLMMNIGAVLCFIVYGISQAEDGQTLALGVMLLVVVLLTSAFQTYQEGKADNIMDELRALAADGVWVYRDGELVQVEAEQLVPGDIVKITAGEKVPADVRIIEATDLKVNNASLTGENVDIKLGTAANHKLLYEAKNIARSGCGFTSGNGLGLVFLTGDHTFFGDIARSTQEIERPDTLMKIEIHRMILILSVLAVILGVAFAILSLFNGFTWVQAVAFGIGIIVANVPEGLLSQLVVTLALTATKLKNVSVIVTNLEIIETLGAVTTICSDKTGTLTCNRMTVSHVVIDGEIHTTPHSANRPDDAFKMVDPDVPECQQLLLASALCNDTIFTADQKGETNILKWETKGSPSEAAFIKWVQPYMDINETRAAHKRVAAIPFNSTNKWMLTVNSGGEGKPYQIIVKGAPEKVIAMCDTCYRGGVQPMDAANIKHFEDTNMLLAGRGERVLGVAALELDLEEYPADFEFDTDADIPNFPTAGLCLLGLVSLIDPPRESVPRSVKDCQAAGIKVMMVTGDHPVTALAISRSIGISTMETAAEIKERGDTVPEDFNGCIVVHGQELLKYDRADWDFTLKHKEIVFARTMPIQKQEIVRELNRLGEVVAMTGDGVNDAPALKAANVGVAMGSGASVAKEAGQIIVQNDDFSSIVQAIRAGRLVFAAMKKVITYVLVSNTPQILPFLFFVAAGIPLGIETIVILTIDLGTDILPAIAMAYEEEEDETMAKPPRKLDDHLVSFKMIFVTYATVGMMHTLTSYFGFFYVLTDLGFDYSDLYGSGLGFRSDYHDLESDRQQYFDELCVRNTRFRPIDGNCTHPESIAQWENYRADALGQAQAAFFMAIVWGQIGNIFIRKTFSESILTVHRLVHNKLLLFSIFFEICLACFLIYLPFISDIFLLFPIKAEYFFCTVWYVFVLIGYDEIRKLIVRKWPKGCVAWTTNF